VSRWIKTLEYMWEDISATVDFYHETKEQIEFREALTIEHQRDFINHNDTKIGKDFFIHAAGSSTAWQLLRLFQRQP
jgi:hypothetical protein